MAGGDGLAISDDYHEKICSGWSPAHSKYTGSIEMKSRIIERILANSIVFALGIIILIPSVYRLFVFSYHHLSSISISGEVVDRGMGRNFGCRPDIRYTDSNGTIREFKTRIIYNFLVCPEKGEKIKILYREGMPEKTIVADYLYHVFLSTIFILIGLYLLYIGGKGKLKQ